MGYAEFYKGDGSHGFDRKDAYQSSLAAQQWSDLGLANERGTGLATAQDAVDRLFGAPMIVGDDGKKYIQGYISNVPEVSQGVRDFDDVRAMGAGIGRGLGKVAESTLQYLARAGAVEKSLLEIGPALDTAVGYYAGTPLPMVGADLRTACGAIAQGVEFSIGLPMTPAQRGEFDGVAMAAFFPLVGKKPLNAQELEALGGAKKLEQMTAAELEAVGVRKVEDYALRRLTKEEVGVENLQVFEARKAMKDGVMTVDIDYIYQPKELPGRPNLIKMFNNIQKVARNEGAVKLHIRGVQANDELFDLLRRRYNMKLEADGLNEGFTIDLDR